MTISRSKLRAVTGLVLLAVVFTALFSAAIPAQARSAGSRPMHRLYNPNSGEHFYTGSGSERTNLVRNGC